MLERIQRNVLAGVLAIIPIVITIWVGRLVLDFLITAGSPFVAGLSRSIRPTLPELADLLVDTSFQSFVAVLCALLILYLLGALTTAVLGRRLFAAFDRIMERIPFFQAIYGAARKLIASFQQTPAGQQRVVLIDFPSPEMKAVGLVTQTFRAADTGQDLAAVYVPTTPNPTSGYIEIVPIEKLVWLDWSTNDAMQFIMSGGTVAPDRINFGYSPKPPGPIAVRKPVETAGGP